MVSNLQINTNIETPADFNDLHNSKHIMQEIFNNNEIANKLHESTVLIDKYIIAFVETFLFTNETIDAYLSLADTETICKKDKFLSLYWVAGMTMSQVLREFQESEYFKTIPLHVDDDDFCHGGYGFRKTKLDHQKEDHHYKNTNYFIDIVHKKMYFVDPEHQIVYRRGNVINVQYSTPYRSWSHYTNKAKAVYPTWNSWVYSYTNMHAKISLNTNTILKSSNDTILTKKEKLARAERLKEHGY